MAHNSCCNPFDLPGLYWNSRGKGVRPVTAQMCERAPQLSIGDKICDRCRKRVSKLVPVEPTELDICRSDPDYVPPVSPSAVSKINECLVDIGQTPISKSKARGKKYIKQKVDKITDAMSHMVSGKYSMNDGDEMIEQLKEKFQVATEKSLKLQILTVLPKSWPIKKIEQEFGVSAYFAQMAKNLVKEKGVLSLPGPKAGPTLFPETVECVLAFYEHDEISRLMPGKKDFVSVKKDGKREHIQKRLVLANLKEVYTEFKSKFPEKKVEFSKFAELRPKHCVLAGASGTHSVCVCTIHQNVKLMLCAAQLLNFPTYHHCLARILCNPPLPRCYLGECGYCPGIETLKEDFVVTCCAPTEEFIDTFCERLELLRSHSFIASQQAAFYAECKGSLKIGEFLVTADFSGNYSFVLQDSAQGFHWNNSQATIHPFVAY